MTAVLCPVQLWPTMVLGRKTTDHELFNLTTEATPHNAHQLRVRFQQWLQTLGAVPAVVDDITLAVYEALANAAEHAYDRDHPTR